MINMSALADSIHHEKKGDEWWNTKNASEWHEAIVFAFDEMLLDVFAAKLQEVTPHSFTSSPEAVKRTWAKRGMRCESWLVPGLQPLRSPKGIPLITMAVGFWSVASPKKDTSSGLFSPGCCRWCVPHFPTSFPNQVSNFIIYLFGGCSKSWQQWVHRCITLWLGAAQLMSPHSPKSHSGFRDPLPKLWGGCT